MGFSLLVVCLGVFDRPCGTESLPYRAKSGHLFSYEVSLVQNRSVECGDTTCSVHCSGDLPPWTGVGTTLDLSLGTCAAGTIMTSGTALSPTSLYGYIQMTAAARVIRYTGPPPWTNVGNFPYTSSTDHRYVSSASLTIAGGTAHLVVGMYGASDMRDASVNGAVTGNAVYSGIGLALDATLATWTFLDYPIGSSYLVTMSPDDEWVLMGSTYLQFATRSHVSVFRRHAGALVLAEVLAPPYPTSAYFGYGMAVAGTTLVVGDSSDTSCGPGYPQPGDPTCPSQGVVHVYALSEGHWQRGEAVRAPVTKPLSFGNAVDLWAGGDGMVVGANGDGSRSVVINQGMGLSDGTSVGSAFVYRRKGGRYVFETYLKGSQTADGHYFGLAVSAWATSTVELIGVSARADSYASPTGVAATGWRVTGTPSGSVALGGAAYLFGRAVSGGAAAGNWTEMAVIRPPRAAATYFGTSLSLRHGLMIIGSATACTLYVIKL